MATNKSQADYHKQGMRIPRELHECLHEAARASGRSYNSELIHRLEESLDGKAIHLPDTIREEFVERARENGWPFESEFLHTIVDALDGHPAGALPADLATMVRVYAEKHGLEFKEALTRVILAGTSENSAPVLRLSLKPGLTAKDLARLFDEAQARVHPEASVVVERIGEPEPRKLQRAPAPEGKPPTPYAAGEASVQQDSQLYAAPDDPSVVGMPDKPQEVAAPRLNLRGARSGAQKKAAK